MKKCFKLVTLALSLIFVLGIFSACSNTSDIESKISDLESEITSLKDDEKTLKDNIKELKDNIKELKDNIKELEDKIKDLEEELDNNPISETFKVFLITMDQMDQHWAKVNDGCLEAVQELKADGVDIEFTWVAPALKDSTKQIEVLNNAVNRGANVIMLASNAPESINDHLEAASKKGVKIIYIDSPASWVGQEQTIATDNIAAGKTAGEEMIKDLEAKGVTSGKIGIIGVKVDTDSTVKREVGFREAFAGKSQWELQITVFKDENAAASAAAATTFFADGCVGVFGTNEGSTIGVGIAVKDYMAANPNAKISGVGFDLTDAIQGLINDGSLYATMAQNPKVMGYEGMKSAGLLVQGKPIVTAKDFNSGVIVVKKA